MKLRMSFPKQNKNKMKQIYGNMNKKDQTWISNIQLIKFLRKKPTGAGPMAKWLSLCTLLWRPRVSLVWILDMDITTRQAMLRRHPTCHNQKDPKLKYTTLYWGEFGEKKQKKKKKRKKPPENVGEETMKEILQENIPELTLQIESTHRVFGITD